MLTHHMLPLLLFVVIKTQAFCGSFGLELHPYLDSVDITPGQGQKTDCRACTIGWSHTVLFIDVKTSSRCVAVVVGKQQTQHFGCTRIS